MLLRNALAIDPSYAPAAALFGFCRGWQSTNGWDNLSDQMTAEAVDFARQAAAAGKDDSDALWMAGQIIAYLAGDHATGRDLIERSLTLNANCALAWCARGYVLLWSAQPEPAIDSFAHAMRLSPLDPLGYMFKHGTAIAHLHAGRFDDAMTWIDQVLRQQPRQTSAIRHKAALCGHLGKLEEGRKWVQKLLTFYPGATIKSIQKFMAANAANAPIVLEGLRKAGLPEE